VLDALVCCAYRQNLTLRQAGCRVLQARAQIAELEISLRSRPRLDFASER
jgi:hypothetical protein